MSQQNAGDYINRRFQRLARNDISPIIQQYANLGKDVNDIKAGHNKIKTILEDIKSKPVMSTQHRKIQVPVAKQPISSNYSRKQSPVSKETREIPPPTSSNNSQQHIPTDINSILNESCDILIIGDSILQRIDESQFHKTKKTACLYKRGGKINDIKSMITKENLQVKEHLIVHVGSNDIAKNAQLNNITQKIELLMDTIKTKFPNVQIAISLPLPRIGNAAFNRTFKKINHELIKLAREHNIYFINHFGVEEDPNAFYADGIHLTNDGTKNLVREVKDVIFKRTQNHNSTP